MTSSSPDPALNTIAARLAQGRRLDRADGLALFASADLHGLGRLAHQLRLSRHGAVTFYNVNRHIHTTNVCASRCSFCGFSRSQDANGAYTLSADQVVAQARQADQDGATEVHMVGGLHPRLTLDGSLEMLRAIRSACPRLHVKAFTAPEIHHLARQAGCPVERVLAAMRHAGLDSLPGGGAEVFSPRVRAEAFSRKCNADEWLAVHAAAHRLGLPSNATMLYGHIETVEERVDHLLRLRDAQDRTGGFAAFVPLAFNPAGTALGHLPGPTGLDDLRMAAVSRLILDNIAHIKTFWVMVGAKLSQLALLFGADDIDGTVVQYDITHRDGASTRQQLSVEQAQELIRQVGQTPVERDSLYRPVIRRGKDWHVEQGR